MFIKSILPYGIGVAIGGIAVYAIYRLIKSRDPNNEKLRKEAEFEARAKIAKEREEKLKELLDNKSYVENLTSKDISSWFKENRSAFLEGAVKMIIAIPSDDILKGLKYPTTALIDKDKNLLQWFYDNNDGKVLKIRLINFANIDTNLQSRMLENNGMLIISE